MNLNHEIVKKVEEFVSREFELHPHYSFNDWTVMRDHSFKVRDLALQIAEKVNADKTIVALGALLHDIGKTYEADAEILHTEHESFNIPVCEGLLNSLGLPTVDLEKVKQIVAHKSESIEMKIIKDADALALYADKRLYTLYIAWARQNKLDSAIQRKLDKFNKLNFPQSRELGLGWYEEMKKDWGV